MSSSIRLTKTYLHPIEKVWSALVEKDSMSRWLMPCDIEPIVGHEFQFRTKPSPGFDGIVYCKVLECVEHELLRFSWSGGSLKATQVSFHLREEDGQTILNFEHAGFEGFLNKLIVKRILSTGWKRKILLVQLPEFLSNE